MKALSMHQPLASLIAVGVKTIETRNWSTKYRGPLAIHATKKHPGPWWSSQSDDEDPRNGRGLPWHDELERFCYGFESTNLEWFGYRWTGPLGAVVATCDLVDVVPMVEKGHQEQDEGDQRYLLVSGLNGHMWLWDGRTAVDVESERPYGHYAPGRFAWILANVEPLPKPIPAKGRQGLWNWDGEV